MEENKNELSIVEQIFQSSVGTGMALRWKAFFAGIIPAIALIGPLLGIDFLNEAFLTAFGNLVSTIIEVVFTLIALYAFIVGQIRAKEMKKIGAGKYRRM